MTTLAEIRSLLARLDEGPADALESEVLEFKAWKPHGDAYRAQIRELRETVVAFANARGGVIVLGVADRKRSRCDAIHGVADLDPVSLRRDIYDGTEPHILVETEELTEPEARLLVLRVPAGIPPHTTTDGVARIRVGKESKPLTGSGLARLVVSRGRRDLTADVLPGVDPCDLDPKEMDRLRNFVRADARRPRLVELPDGELLDALGLTSGNAVTHAALLLAGSWQQLSKRVPGHEVIFTRETASGRYDVRKDLRGPLLAVLDDIQRLLEAHMTVATIDPNGFQQLEIPDVSWCVAREAILNAVVHRDYFLRQSIHIRVCPGHIEVTSPGGFIGGITPRNVLRHPPVRRNALLADALQAIGLVNRVGLGVDRIYQESLSLGKDLPKYEADESHVRLVVPTTTNSTFARFVSDVRRGGGTLGLDDLIALRGIAMRQYLDRWSAAELLQLSDTDAAVILSGLKRRGFLVSQGRGRATIYRLAHRYSALVREPERLADDIWLDDESVRLRVLTVLADRGRLTNADIRRLSGYSRTQVLKLMGRLRAEGLVCVKGRGRAAHYVLSPESSG